MQSQSSESSTSSNRPQRSLRCARTLAALALVLVLTTLLATLMFNPRLVVQLIFPCRFVAGFEQTTDTPALGPRFADVGFPAGAVGFLSTAPEVNGYQTRLVRACARTLGGAPGAYYRAALVHGGWKATDFFPVDGDPSKPCPSPHNCYRWNDGSNYHIRFLEVEAVRSAGATGLAVTFTVRLMLGARDTGGALMLPGETLDVDPNAPTIHHDDIRWTGDQLEPIDGALLRNVGAGSNLDALSYADVATLTYDTTPVAADALLPGDLFAVKTGDGRLAKAQVASLDKDTDWLTLDFITYGDTF
jgi:hypothetical protein